MLEVILSIEFARGPISSSPLVLETTDRGNILFLIPDPVLFHSTEEANMIFDQEEDKREDGGHMSILDTNEIILTHEH